VSAGYLRVHRSLASAQVHTAALNGSGSTVLPVTGSGVYRGITLFLADHGCDITSHGTSFCSPGQGGIRPCPCMNPPTVGHGCDNSSATGGAQLAATGVAGLAADTLLFTSTGELPQATSVFLQGTTQITTGVAFGQGVRCVGGSLKRLYVHNATGGTVSAPIGADLSVSARSAALGHSIAAGETLYYMVYYRDPIVLGGCPSTSTFNATQGLAVPWAP
jgi:hypothetical protein